MIRPSFHEYFMAIAKITSIRSTCSSRPVGCVIVKDNRILATGYNGVPSNEPHCIDKSTPEKLYCARRENNISNQDKQSFCKAIHAEENALLSLKYMQNKDNALIGATIYVTLSPCLRCITKLNLAGIKHVYYEYQYTSCDPAQDEKWKLLAEISFETYKQFNLTHNTQAILSKAIVTNVSERRMQSK